VKHVTRVITDESQVPDGYVRISDLAPDLNTSVKSLSKLHVDGLVPAVKLMRTAKDLFGPVWVDREIAVKAIRSVAARVRQDISTMFDTPPQSDAAERAVSLLERIASSLDLIADAATRVATTSEAKDAAQSYE